MCQEGATTHPISLPGSLVGVLTVHVIHDVLDGKNQDLKPAPKCKWATCSAPCRRGRIRVSKREPETGRELRTS
jgi:hypothetical protein